MSNLFQEQTKNVKYLKKVQNILRKDINHYIKKNDSFSVKYKTLQYAHLYSALSEAEFLQMLLTPNKFTSAEIATIKRQQSIEKKWNALIEIAFNKANASWQSVPDLHSKHDFILDLIEKYVKGPKNLRNKIAHGQWVIALNSNNTAVDSTITNDLNQLDMVKISIWFEVHHSLCDIVRDLIQSANNAFLRDFNKHCTYLQNFISKTSSWTIADKKKLLDKRKRKNI